MRASTTRRTFVALGLTLALLGGSAAGALAQDSWTVGDIEVREVWARSAMKGRSAAAYLEIVNHGSEPDRLVAADSPVAEKVSLHRHTMVEGVMKMRPVPAIEVPGGGTVVLQPGGFHIMLMKLREPLKSGMQIPLTLTFARAGTVEVVAHVRPAGAMSGMAPDHGKGEDGKSGSGSHGD